MSVDTYIGSRNLNNYVRLQYEDVEVLVSRTLSPQLQSITLDCAKFLFLHKLKALLELSKDVFARRLEQHVERSPEKLLPRLRELVESATPEELRLISGRYATKGWGPRRVLIWLAERLAQFHEPVVAGETEESRGREEEPHVEQTATANGAKGH